jgi:hypothetical protein
MPRHPDWISPVSPSISCSGAMTRQPRFFTDIDRTRYQQDLHEFSLKLRKTGVRVHFRKIRGGAGKIGGQSVPLPHIRWNIWRQSALINSPFLAAIDRQLGRRVGPLRGCRQPKVKLTAGKINSDPCFRAVI